MNKINKAATAAFVMSAIRRHLGHIAYDKHKLEVTENPRFDLKLPADVFKTIESVLTDIGGPTQEKIEGYLCYSMWWECTHDGSEFWLSQHQLWKEEWRRIVKSGLPESWREMLTKTE